jgi:hypothetical protein
MLNMALSGCTKPTYKELLANAKYKVGDTIVIDRGHWEGCRLLVQAVEPRYDAVAYLGVSEDCPKIKGWLE